MRLLDASFSSLHPLNLILSRLKFSLTIQQQQELRSHSDRFLEMGDGKETTDKGLYSSSYGMYGQYGCSTGHNYGYPPPMAYPPQPQGYPSQCYPPQGYEYPPSGYPSAGYSAPYAASPYGHNKPGLGPMLAGGAAAAAAAYGAHHMSRPHYGGHQLGYGGGYYGSHGYFKHGKFKHGKSGKNWGHGGGYGSFGYHGKFKKWK